MQSKVSFKSVYKVEVVKHSDETYTLNVLRGQRPEKWDSYVGTISDWNWAHKAKSQVLHILITDETKSFFDM